MDNVIFRVHGTAMEPCFRDGEFLEVRFGEYSLKGPGAEIVVCYLNGRNELVDKFGEPASDQIKRYGYVVRRVAVVSPKQKALRIDATTDARWRERHKATRTLFRR